MEQTTMNNETNNSKAQWNLFGITFLLIIPVILWTLVVVYSDELKQISTVLHLILKPFMLFVLVVSIFTFAKRNPSNLLRILQKRNVQHQEQNH